MIPSEPIPPPRVGGFTPFTTIDFPGELAAVVYLQGCPWRCRYCHNGELLDTGVTAPVAWDDVLEKLHARCGLLDAVVFSGGEPTAQQALTGAIRQVRELGFKVGLHSAGCYPQRLAALIPMLDWVGLDIKALPQDYPALTGVTDSGERAFESLRLVRGSGVRHEVRVTVHGRLLESPRLQRLLDELQRCGVNQPVLQRCRDVAMLDPGLGRNCQPWPDGERCSPAEHYRINRLAH